MIKGSRLLINEPPLMVMPSLAVAVGLNEALFLQQLHYWLEKSSHKKNGYVWIYNTYDEWLKQFPFWSLSTLRRTITSLEKKNLVITDHFNKLGIDKTKWYRIDYDALNRVNSPCVQNEQTMCSEWTDEVSNMNRALPEITTEREKEEEAVPVEPKTKPNVFTFYEQNFRMLTSFITGQLNGWLDDFNGNHEILILALQEAVLREKPYKYADSILNDWYKQGVKTVSDAEAVVAKFNREQEKKLPPKKSKQVDWDEITKRLREEESDEEK